LLKTLAKEIEAEEPSARQLEVLEAALGILVRDGGKLTMSAVAAEANCSKETLYKWFGGRDGLLSAIVRGQAAQVRVEALDRKIDRAALIERLTHFAEDWLRVVSSERSLALNRLAIGHAGEEGAALGRIVLENGRFALGEKLKPVLEAAREAKLLAFENAEDAFRTFFGLVARDVHIRLLLGERLKLTRANIAADAARAADQFMSLFEPVKKQTRT
jgi:AcrR family transcriptional regulator